MNSRKQIAWNLIFTPTSYQAHLLVPIMSLRTLILLSRTLVNSDSISQSILRSASEKMIQGPSVSNFVGLLGTVTEAYVDDNSELFANTFGLTGFNIFIVANQQQKFETVQTLNQFITSPLRTASEEIVDLVEVGNAGYSPSSTVPLSVLKAAVYSYGSSDVKLNYIAKGASNSVRLIAADMSKNDGETVETSCSLSVEGGSLMQVSAVSNTSGFLTRFSASIANAGAVCAVSTDESSVHMSMRAPSGGGFMFYLRDGVQRTSDDPVVLGFDSVDGLFIDIINGERINNVASINDVDGNLLVSVDGYSARIRISSGLFLRVDFDQVSMVIDGSSGDSVKLQYGESIGSESSSIRRLLETGAFVSNVGSSVGVDAEILIIEPPAEPPSVNGEVLNDDSKDSILSSLSSMTNGEKIVFEVGSGVDLDSSLIFVPESTLQANNNEPLQLIGLNGNVMIGESSSTQASSSSIPDTPTVCSPVPVDIYLYNCQEPTSGSDYRPGCVSGESKSLDFFQNSVPFRCSSTYNCGSLNGQYKCNVSPGSLVQCDFPPVGFSQCVSQVTSNAYYCYKIDPQITSNFVRCVPLASPRRAHLRCSKIPMDGTLPSSGELCLGNVNPATVPATFFGTVCYTGVNNAVFGCKEALRVKCSTNPNGETSCLSGETKTYWCLRESDFPYKLNSCVEVESVKYFLYNCSGKPYEGDLVNPSKCKKGSQAYSLGESYSCLQSLGAAAAYYECNEQGAVSALTTHCDVNIASNSTLVCASAASTNPFYYCLKNDWWTSRQCYRVEPVKQIFYKCSSRPLQLQNPTAANCTSSPPFYGSDLYSCYGVTSSPRNGTVAECDLIAISTHVVQCGVNPTSSTTCDSPDSLYWYCYKSEPDSMNRSCTQIDSNTAVLYFNCGGTPQIDGSVLSSNCVPNFSLGSYRSCYKSLAGYLYGCQSPKNPVGSLVACNTKTNLVGHSECQVSGSKYFYCYKIETSNTFKECFEISSPNPTLLTGCNFSPNDGIDPYIGVMPICGNPNGTLSVSCYIDVNSRVHGCTRSRTVVQCGSSPTGHNSCKLDGTNLYSCEKVDNSIYQSCVPLQPAQVYYDCGSVTPTDASVISSSTCTTDYVATGLNYRCYSSSGKFYGCAVENTLSREILSCANDPTIDSSCNSLTIATKSWFCYIRNASVKVGCYLITSSTIRTSYYNCLMKPQNGQNPLDTNLARCSIGSGANEYQCLTGAGIYSNTVFDCSGPISR